MRTKNIKIAGLLLIAILTLGSLAGCGSKPENTGDNASRESTASDGEFAEFAGKDIDGNKVDQSIIKENKATVLNFWFNGCSACVEEMPDLEKFNKTLKEKNAELVGVNVDMVDKSDIKEAKELLKKQGATYKNIEISEGDKAVGYMDDLMAFPTTIVVDQNGNIIGEPICGSLDESMMKEIVNRIDSINNTSK